MSIEIRPSTSGAKRLADAVQLCTSSAQVNVRLAWEYQFKITQDCSPKALSESLWEFGARHLSDRLAECTTVKSADEEECRAGCNNHTAVGFQQFAHVGVII